MSEVAIIGQRTWCSSSFEVCENSEIEEHGTELQEHVDILAQSSLRNDARCRERSISVVLCDAIVDIEISWCVTQCSNAWLML